MLKSDIVIRDVVQDDVAFIASTWLKGLLYGGDPLFRKIPSDVYFFNQHQIIEKILTSPVAVVRVACLKDDQDVILGYSVLRSSGEIVVLDFIFVKKNWRGIGVGKSLLPEKFDAVTNLTRPAEAILASKFPKVIFNPYL